MTTRLFRLHVNGTIRDVEASNSASLLDVLRGPLALPGTKANCLEAECGVCTVLLDGRAVTSCLVLAAHARARGRHHRGARRSRRAASPAERIPRARRRTVRLLHSRHDHDGGRTAA